MALAPLPVWKDTFILNSLTAEYQLDADIVGLANGNFLAVWSDDNQVAADGTGYDIVGQLFDPFGNKIGGTLFLNDGFGTVREEDDPVVTAMDDGGFMLVYTHDVSGETDALFRRFDADGTPTGVQNFLVNNPAGNLFYGDYEAVTRPDGSVVVVYDTVDFDTGTQTIAFRVIATDGTVGAETTIRSDFGGTDNPRDPALTVLKDGRVVVVFEETDASQVGVEYRIIDTDNTMGFVPNVNTTYPADDPAVASLSNGGFVVVWREGSEVIKGRIYSSNEISGAVKDLAFSPGDSKGPPQVIGLPEGGFALAWIDFTNREVAVQLFDNDGNVTSVQTDLAFPLFEAFGLQLSLTDDGRILLAWEEYTDGTYANSEVYGAIIDPRDGSFTAGKGGFTIARDAGGEIIGTFGDDTIIGAAGEDILNGNGGNDDLRGNGGADELFGGAGRDTLSGGKQADFLDGNGADDLLFGGAGADTLLGSNGSDELIGGGGGDALFGVTKQDILYGGGGKDEAYGGSASDILFGGKDADELFGGNGDDAIFGDGGADRIVGGANADLMLGGGGGDDLSGGRGADIIFGGGGQDSMSGGTGRDIFAWLSVSESAAGAARADVITDFTRGQDKLALELLELGLKNSDAEDFVFGVGDVDFDTIDTSGTVVEFINRAAFTGDGDTAEVRWSTSGNGVLAEVDFNGNGSANMSIVLRGVTSLNADDFLL